MGCQSTHMMAAQFVAMITTLTCDHTIVWCVASCVYLSIYNKYSAKLQKAISGRGKNSVVPFEDKQKNTIV